MTLVPDVEVRVKEMMDQEGIAFKEAINRVLRAGLDELDRQRPPQEPFRVKPLRGGGLQPGLDPNRSLTKQLDELEDVARARRMGLMR